MRSIFSDACCIFFYCLGKGKTITSEYYEILLDRLSKEIKKSNAIYDGKKVSFINLLFHTSLKATAKLDEFNHEFHHPHSYSLDKSHCKCCLFPDGGFRRRALHQNLYENFKCENNAIFEFFRNHIVEKVSKYYKPLE